MANGHGGYRKPTNPAPVSGPGAHSQRTDGQQPVMTLPNAQYGEGQQFQQIQQGASVPQTGALAPSQPATLADLISGVTPLTAPSGQPSRPVTDGAAMGPGAGTSALNLPMQNPNTQDAQYLQKYLPMLMKQANNPDSPPGYRSWVRNVVSNLL